MEVVTNERTFIFYLHFHFNIDDLGLIMYILTTLEFPKHNHDFHILYIYIYI